MGSAATEESPSVAERRRRGVFGWEEVLEDLFIVFKAKMGKKLKISVSLSGVMFKGMSKKMSDDIISCLFPLRSFGKYERANSINEGKEGIETLFLPSLLLRLVVVGENECPRVNIRDPVHRPHPHHPISPPIIRPSGKWVPRPTHLPHSGKSPSYPSIVSRRGSGKIMWDG